MAVLLWGIKRRRQWSKTQQQGGRYQRKMQIRAEARVEPQDDDAAPEAPKAEEGGGNNTPQQTEATVEPHEDGPVCP